MTHHVPLQENTFEDFKARIAPFIRNARDIAMKQLILFEIVDTEGLTISKRDVKDYELFVHCCHQSKPIIPSLEVQILWNIHSLNPRKYFGDSHRAFGKVISVEITPNDKFISRSEMSKALQSEYAADTVSEFVCSLNLKEALLRQIKFIRKIKAIQNTETITASKLDVAMERYIKFLFLMTLEGISGDRRMSVPALDVDLIWHSHQMDAVNYHKMSKFMFPDRNVIDHDDSFCYTKEMQKCREEMQKRWTNVFGAADYFSGRAFGHKVRFNKDGHVFKKHVPLKRKTRAENIGSKRDLRSITTEELAAMLKECKNRTRQLEEERSTLRIKLNED